MLLFNNPLIKLNLFLLLNDLQFLLFNNFNTFIFPKNITFNDISFLQFSNLQFLSKFHFSNGLLFLLTFSFLFHYFPFFKRHLAKFFILGFHGLNHNSFLLFFKRLGLFFFTVHLDLFLPPSLPLFFKLYSFSFLNFKTFDFTLFNLDFYSISLRF